MNFYCFTSKYYVPDNFFGTTVDVPANVQPAPPNGMQVSIISVPYPITQSLLLTPYNFS